MDMTQTAPAALRIVEILDVTDTRAYEEQGDRWVPIPGSGNLNECARCRRMHEVHATVRLSDGSVIVVGTGCMGSDTMAKAARSATRKAGGARSDAARKVYQAEYGRLFAGHPDMIAICAESKQMIAAKNYFNNAEYLARETAIYKRVHAEVRESLRGFRVAPVVGSLAA